MFPRVQRSARGPTRVRSREHKAMYACGGLRARTDGAGFGGSVARMLSLHLCCRSSAVVNPSTGFRMQSEWLRGALPPAALLCCQSVSAPSGKCAHQAKRSTDSCIRGFFCYICVAVCEGREIRDRKGALLFSYVRNFDNFVCREKKLMLPLLCSVGGFFNLLHG